MAATRRRRRTKRKAKKAKGSVKVKQSMQLRQKSDSTKLDSTRKAPSQTIVLDNGANFKITIKKKRH